MKYRLKKDLKKGDLIDTNLGSDVCEEVKEGRWKPEDGEGFFYIDVYNDIESDEWNCFPFDIDRYSMGNVFRTKKEAEKALARQKAIVELEDLCDGMDIIKMPHYQIFFTDGNFGVLRWVGIHSPYRFASEESAQHAIKTLGDEKLKLIFRIET